MKTIKIDGKEYKIHCTAYTKFQYKQLFGRGIFKDIKVLNQMEITRENTIKKAKEENPDITPEELDSLVGMEVFEDLDEVIDVMLRIAYVEILTANPKFNKSFEDFVKWIENIKISEAWVSEVTELAVASFCG